MTGVPRGDGHGRPRLVLLPGGAGVSDTPRPPLADFLAAHPEAVARFKAYRCTAGGPDSCWWWTGAINGGTGHGELHLAYLPAADGQRREWVEYAHRIAYVLGGGRLEPDTVVRHLCDEPSCTNPGCLAGGDRRDNALDWLARRGDPASPLTDRRGPAGRAQAIRQAILTAGDDPAAQLTAARAAAETGLPAWRQLTLLTVPDLLGRRPPPDQRSC